MTCLARQTAIAERTTMHAEMRKSIGASLFVMNHEEWLPRRRMLQPLFTKKHVRAYGNDMAQAAETIAASWGSGRDIDLDLQCRKLTMRALGRSVLGLDLDEQADRMSEPLRIVLEYVADRALSPVPLPRWVPTRTNRRARAASAELRSLAADVLKDCRENPDRDAPLVRALMSATDPVTGRGLTDAEIRDELIVFMSAGHDTTATTMAYALWELGRHPEIQERVRAEVEAIGDRRLTPEDVTELGYTVQVLHEALRLCPPAAAIGRLVTAGHRGGRIPRQGGFDGGGRRLCAPARPAALGPRDGVRPGPVPARRWRRPSTAGSTCRSGQARARASATTSRCSSSRWPWRRSCARVEIRSAGRRFPMDDAVHDGRGRAGSGSNHPSERLHHGERRRAAPPARSAPSAPAPPAPTPGDAGGKHRRLGRARRRAA